MMAQLAAIRPHPFEKIYATLTPQQMTKADNMRQWFSSGSQGVVPRSDGWGGRWDSSLRPRHVRRQDFYLFSDSARISNNRRPVTIFVLLWVCGKCLVLPVTR